MRLDEARLRAYLDDELPPPERQMAEKELAGSLRAQRALAQLRRDRALVSQALDRLTLPADTFTPAWLALKQLRSQTAPARPGPLVANSALNAWEAPSLLEEIKTFFQNARPKQRQSKGAFLMSKKLLWITSIGLIVAAIAVAAGLRPDIGQQLARRVEQVWPLGKIITGVVESDDQLPEGLTPGATVFDNKLAGGDQKVVPTAVVSTTTVIVAVQPISRGSEITPGEIGRREWPANNLPPGRIGDAAEAIGQIARTDIVQGQVIVRQMLREPAAAMRFELKSVRQLTPCENKGRNLLLVKVEDTAGAGLNDIPVKIQWQAGPDEFALVKTETLANGPGWIEFAMAEDRSYTVAVQAGASQVASDLTTTFGQEELCNGGPGNAPNHLSFEIIFRQAETGPDIAASLAGDTSFDYGIQADPHGDTQANIGHPKVLGFGWVKLRMPWKEVEPAQGRYSWQPWDEVIDAYAANGIRVMLNIVHAPEWARPADDDRSVEGLPADPSTYADFVGRVAARYQGQVQAIEIWNEQNIWYKVGGRGRIDAAGYAPLLQEAYQAIKAVNQDMLVISGGLSPAGNVGDLALDDIDYLQQMYDSGVKGYFDALGAQPLGYNCPALADWRTVTPEEATADPRHGLFTNRHHSWCFLGTLEGYREVMEANGDNDTPIWVTEFGWAVAGSPEPGYEFAADNTPEEQAQWIVEAYDWAAARNWVGPMFLWNLDYGVTAVGTELATYGIIGTPAYDALLERQNQRVGQATASPAPGLAHCPPAPPAPASFVRFSSPDLGFTLAYPQEWQKLAAGRFVIVSPSEEGLDPEALAAVSIWAGRAPAALSAASLLEAHLSGFPTVVETLNESPLEIGGETWISKQIRFADSNLCGQAVAMAAATIENGQGYFLVAVAPAPAWNDVQPVFQQMLDSFHFLPQ